MKDERAIVVNEIPHNEYTSEDTIKRMEKCDIPKYKKKTKSNTSKAKEKTKHKHEYKDCLFINNGRAYMGTYCNICGKIYNWRLPVVTVEEAGHRRMMTNEEVLEEYKNLEKIEVQDLCAKYIQRREIYES